MIVAVLLGFDGSVADLLLLMGFISDIADGMVMRRLGITSLSLLRGDTRVDILFYTCAICAATLKSPKITAQWFPWMEAYLCLFVLRTGVDYYRYHASPSYHMWSGKLRSLCIVIVLLAAFSGLSYPILMKIAFTFYAVNTAEGVVVSFLLPVPGSDIPTVLHALRRYQEDRGE